MVDSFQFLNSFEYILLRSKKAGNLYFHIFVTKSYFKISININ